MTDTFTAEEHEKAATLASEIQAFIDSNRQHKSALEQNFVEIGERLVAIRRSRYWKLFGFQNFTLFMKSLDGRTQNYHCLGVARDLLTYVSKADLVSMGISKAAELRLMVKGAKPITPELVELAIKGTQEELEDEVAKQLGLVEEEPGEWFGFGGARLSDEEKAIFLRTVNAAIKAAGLESEAITEWKGVPSAKKKQILLEVIFPEFLSSYGS